MTVEAKPAQDFDPFGPPPSRAVEPSHALLRVVDESVIHDLRNPLTSVLGNMRLVEEMVGPTLDPRMRDRMAASIRSAEELNAMLGDLQQLLWLQSGEFSMPVTSSTVGDLVKHLGAAGQERAAADGRTLEIVSSVNEAVISGYVTHVLRALELLLHASLRLSRSGPVRIEAGPHSTPGRLAFSFSYTGLRIPPGLSGSLFTFESATLQRDYGVRVDRSRALMFVRAVAKLHGGEISYAGGEDGGVFYLVIADKTAGGRVGEMDLFGGQAACGGSRS